MLDAGLEAGSSRAFWGFSSSLGTMSMRKSNWSYLEMAIAMSFLCRVRLLLSSVWIQALKVNSVMKSSAAFEKRTGASALIIFTSSSSFIIFLMRANGNSCCLKSFWFTRFIKVKPSVMNKPNKWFKNVLTLLRLFTSSPTLGQKLANAWVASVWEFWTMLAWKGLLSGEKSVQKIDKLLLVKVSEFLQGSRRKHFEFGVQNPTEIADRCFQNVRFCDRVMGYQWNATGQDKEAWMVVRFTLSLALLPCGSHFKPISTSQNRNVTTSLLRLPSIYLIIWRCV